MEEETKKNEQKIRIFKCDHFSSLSRSTEVRVYLKNLNTQSGETIMASSEIMGLLNNTVKQGHIFDREQEWL